MKILLGSTTSAGLKTYYAGLGSYLQRCGHSVGYVAPVGRESRQMSANEGVALYPLKISRDPDPFADLKSFVELFRILRGCRPDLTIWGSPKISLLGVIATRILRVRSVYVIHGLRYEGSTGIRRTLLQLFEAVIILLAGDVMAVSLSVRDQVERDRLCRPGTITVLGSGSANGCLIPPESVLDNKSSSTAATNFLFVGRITKDKGLRELMDAWDRVLDRHPDLSLRLAGRIESDINEAEFLGWVARRSTTVEYLSHLDDLSDAYSAADVLVLPSYREGLPTVVLEAGSFGVPSIVTDSTGAAEAVEEGETGLVIERKNTVALVNAIETYAEEIGLASRHGLAMRKIVEDRYSRTTVHRAWSDWLSDVGFAR